VPDIFKMFFGGMGGGDMGGMRFSRGGRSRRGGGNSGFGGGMPGGGNFTFNFG